jgi:transposase InsO family protein
VTVFGFIAARKTEHSVKTMCRVLGVSRSGYHAWERRPPSPRLREDVALTEWIGRIHELSLKTYGSPRVHAELRLDHGIHVGRKRVERLMRRAGLSGQVRRRRGKTTIRVQGVRTAPDLVKRDFDPSAPNRLWAADITYIRTWEGWLYLASVMDCYSRRIVGWAIADHLRAELVVDALEMAVTRRRPDERLVHHSDHGSQVHVAGLHTALPHRRDRHLDGQPRRLLRQRRPGELPRHDQEGPHPPPRLADQDRGAHRGLRVHRDVLQPPAPPLAARDALARRLREQNSRDRRDESRRFAARVHQQDRLQDNVNGPSRLTTACPPKRGRSNQRLSATGRHAHMV